MSSVAQKRRVITGIAVVSLAVIVANGCRGSGEEPPSLATIVLSAEVGELKIEHGPRARGKAPEDWVEIELEGRIFRPTLRAGVLERDVVSWQTPADAAVSEFSALKMDDVQWILDNVVEEEQLELGEYLVDEDGRAGVRRFYSQVSTLNLWAELYYADIYALVVYSHDDSPERYLSAYRKTDGGWKNTQELENNEILAVVEAAFRAGEVAEKRP